MAQGSLEAKLDALCGRVNKLEAENSGLRLLVRELALQVDVLRTRSLHNGMSGNTQGANELNKTMTTLSTSNSNYERTKKDDKSGATLADFHRVDKRKDQKKEAKNILTPSNTLHNHTCNQPNLKTGTITHKPLAKLEDIRTLGSTPTSAALKAQSRKILPSSPSASTLPRSISQNRKTTCLFSFDSSNDRDKKVVNIEKLEPSYHNSPKNNSRIEEMLNQDDEFQNDDRIALEKSYRSVGPSLKSDPQTPKLRKIKQLHLHCL